MLSSPWEREPEGFLNSQRLRLLGTHWVCVPSKRFLPPGAGDLLRTRNGPLLMCRIARERRGVREATAFGSAAVFGRPAAFGSAATISYTLARGESKRESEGASKKERESYLHRTMEGRLLLTIACKKNTNQGSKREREPLTQVQVSVGCEQRVDLIIIINPPTITTTVLTACTSTTILLLQLFLCVCVYVCMC